MVQHSVLAKMGGIGSDHVDLKQIGKDQLGIYEHVLKSGMAVRKRWAKDPAMASVHQASSIPTLLVCHMPCPHLRATVAVPSACCLGVLPHQYAT